MTIDVTQFHSVFFEESEEGLEVMETGLLHLQTAAEEVDKEQLNTIFRAAHSIKGGAGTFGFSDIADFTHTLETVLDQLRQGQLVWRTSDQSALLNTLLAAVDVLRQLFSAVKQKTAVDQASVAAVSQALATWLTQPNAEDEPVPTMSDPEENRGWLIDFNPFPELLQTGNDPVRLFAELAELGELNVQLIEAELPEFAAFDPEACYLSWQLTLLADVSREEIESIFEWVEGDCELVIEPLASVREGEDQPPVEPVSQEPLPAEAGTTVTPPTSQASLTTKGTDNQTSSIRVGTDKVDGLINLVGELVITQSMLGQLGDDFEMRLLPNLKDGLEQLERNTRELQEQIMRIRMLPISFAFNRLPRLVHDLSSKLGKQVELKLTGEQTELDKTVLEKIGDPLIHLVRNSLDHGLETAEQRLAAGKPASGLLHLHAYHQGGNILIEIEDDGAGLNEAKIRQKAIEHGLIAATDNLSSEQIQALIFLPGFSTAEAISDISGRGVGMDVVRQNIQSLGGNIEVTSVAGSGTQFRIRLPLTLAIIDGQIIQVADQRYILPLMSIIESVEYNALAVKQITGRGEVYSLREQYLPLVRLQQVFNLEMASTQQPDYPTLLVVVEANGQQIGIHVDELLSQQQVVIKSLETHFRKVAGVTGATILGDGQVALILDIAGLMTLARQSQRLAPSLSTEAA